MLNVPEVALNAAVVVMALPNVQPPLELPSTTLIGPSVTLFVVMVLPVVVAKKFMTAPDVAKEYYSPILFLILGGAFLALTIERTGMHRRVALAILGKSGHTRRFLKPILCLPSRFLPTCFQPPM